MPVFEPFTIRNRADAAESQAHVDFGLWALGGATRDEIYRKGVAFLLSTQYQDGAWLVKTHSFPQQRYFESGFPFGRHQWISSAGTSWATLAIAETLPDGKKGTGR